MIEQTWTDGLTGLYAANTPATFWRVLVEPRASAAEWAAAVEAATTVLPPTIATPGRDVACTMGAVLGEMQFGERRFRLGVPKRLYYCAKPLVPYRFTILLRRLYRRHQERNFPLGWPIEDRYVRFQYRCVDELLRRRGLDSAPYISLWPDGHRFALTLTHDVEDERGLAFLPTIADLEERLGYRSVFNLVPGRYAVDAGLLHDLCQRGFEIGLHGLLHDGHDFASKRVFERRAARINAFAHAWHAVGFRAPFTHRHPQWMQALQIEYDSSFSDTDPYEPMPGGTMSIWPFFLGHFVELPYTLAQDHTLITILGQRTPQLWLDKVDFIERHRGLALINAHPDYLREKESLALYVAFLQAMKERSNYWHALPRDAARWWRHRAAFQVQRRDQQWDLSGLPGATLAYRRRGG